MKRFTFILSFFFAFVVYAAAQSPSKINYQATIRNNSGQLMASTSVSMRISILQSSSSGIPVYSENHLVTTTAQGIINLQIGSGSTSDDLSAISWNDGPYFLKVEVDPEGGNDFISIGTSELVSVPFAMSANSAGKVNWLDIQNKPDFAAVTESGSFNDLADKPIIPVNTNELINGAGFAILPLQTGNNNRYLMTNGTDTYWNYAVNTAGSPLYINNNTINIPKATTSANGYLSSSDWNLFNSKVSSRWNASGSDIYFNSGNVGIGTSTPNSKLQIVANVTGENRALIRLRNTDDSYNSIVSMALESNDGIYGSAFTQTSASYAAIPDFDRMGVISSNGKGFSIYSVSDYGSIRFYTNRNENGIIERMRIDPNGNIGIGTTTPSSLLNLYGNIGSGNERNIFQLHNINQSALAYTGIKLKTGFSEGHSVIQDYGMTYTASPYYDFAGFLNVANSNRGVMFHANSAEGVIKFYTGHNDTMGAGLERLRIDANGNIGINTDIVKSKLQVADGDIYISDINKGIIMTSPDGKCWRGTINNSGVLEFNEIDCP